MKKLLSFTLFFAVTLVNAQNTQLTAPQASQKASVMQRIGLTDITITYNSPVAKGRSIWGDLVPYNEVWRAGANENTTISFSSDVTIEGKPLAAGKYGLHMIPSQKEWVIIFNKNAAAWGSFFYDETQDALRVTVKPVAAEAQDWLSYSFASPQPNSVTAMLRWEKLAVPFTINVDVAEMVYQNMRKELTGVQGFFWQGHNQAALWCLQNNIHLDEATLLADKSIKTQKTFANLRTKAKLLTKEGKQEEAEALKKEAFALADENELNAYGYQLLGEGKNTEALDIFRMNVKRYPASWNVYDSLAEAQEKSGDNKNAVGNYKTALSKAPDDQKKRLNETIKKLEASL